VRARPIRRRSRALTTCKAVARRRRRPSPSSSSPPATRSRCAGPPAAGLPLERRALQVGRGTGPHRRRRRRARARPHAGRSLRRMGAAPLRRRRRRRRRRAAEQLSGGLRRPRRQTRPTATASPLSPGEQNYLELYGIPPTMSVLRDRFLGDAAPRLRSDLRTSRSCSPSIRSRPGGATSEQKELTRFRAREQRLEAARIKASAPTLEALADARSPLRQGRKGASARPRPSTPPSPRSKSGSPARG